MPKDTAPPALPDRVELIVPDMSGIPRGKVISGASFDPAHLPHLPAAVFFQTLTGNYADAMDEYNAADSDVLLRPDWSTLKPVSWKGEDQGQVLCATLEKSGQPVAYDPRNMLIGVLDQYRKEGLGPVIAPELEFYLLATGTPPDAPFEPAAGEHGSVEHGGEAFSIDALEKYRAFIDAVEDGCRAAGIDLSGIVHEMGPAQVELNIRHGAALDRTDQLFQMKRIVKACAQQHGLVASFLAKPLAGRAGSGLHLHVSAYRGDENVFALADGAAPESLRHFIGGLQRHLPDAFALIAPNVNSYKRFVPDLSAPINLEWGYDNRTTGFRVPFDEDANGRIENRIIGADASPYLAMAATLGCGLLGMRQRIEPTLPIEEDAYHLQADLPRDLGSALDRLHANTDLCSLFGKPFVEVYLSVKAHELAHFRNEISPWERRFLGAEL